MRPEASQTTHAEARFPAMGSVAHVVVTGGTPAQLDRARARIGELEARWTRFRDDSELSRVNRSRGWPVIVSADTYCLLEHAVTGWERTGGAYDPTVLPALRAAGYDCDFRAITDTPVAELSFPAPGCAEIDLDPATRCVILPPGVEVDPGGIGKGLAADLVTAELIDAGAAGAMVSLGGDLRVRGEAPDADVWSLAVEHPHDPGCLVQLGIADGAVATSSTLRRRWKQGGAERHHLIDPRTGRPADTDLVAATVVAADGWWAEAATKAVLVGGALPPDAVVATVADDGTVHLSPELQAVAA